MADQANAVFELPRPDFGGALARLVQYVQDGVEVNRDVAQRWTASALSMAEGAKGQLEAAAAFAAGHGASISSWLTDEAALLTGARRS